MNNAQLDMVLGYLNEGTEIDTVEFLYESLQEEINSIIIEDVEVFNEGLVNTIKTIIGKIVELIKKFVGAISKFISAIFSKLTGKASVEEAKKVSEDMKKSSIEEMNKKINENEERIKETIKKNNEEIDEIMQRIAKRHQEANEFIRNTVEKMKEDQENWDSRVSKLNHNLDDMKGTSKKDDVIDAEYTELDEAVYNIAKISNSDLKSLVFVEVDVVDNFDQFIKDYERIAIYHELDNLDNIEIDNYIKITDSSLKVKKFSLTTPIPPTMFENYIKTFANKIRVVQKNIQTLEKYTNTAQYSKGLHENNDDKVSKKLYAIYNFSYTWASITCRLYKDYLDLLKTALVTAHNNIKILRKYVI